VQKVLYGARAAVFCTRALICCTRSARTANPNTRTEKLAFRTRTVNNSFEIKRGFLLHFFPVLQRYRCVTPGFFNVTV